MDVEIKGKPSFSHLHITLNPGESIISEADAMASMSPDIDHSIQLNGGFLHAILIKMFGCESMFMNKFTNRSSAKQSLVLSQPTPGDICEVELNNEGLYIQPGAFLGCTPGITPHFKWAGFKSWFAGEGLFRIYVSGKGKFWYGGYGCLFPYKLDGAYIVDSSHLISYPATVSINVQLAGKGLISSFFSKEGFVTRLQGKGTVYLQSRSLSGLASVINQRIV